MRPLTYTYSTDGTRRLLSETETGGIATTWGYDVFGNRNRQYTGSSDTSAFEPTDNRLRNHKLTVGSNTHWFWYDHAGSRIGSSDTLNNAATWDTRMTYTAAGQLAWSLNSNVPGTPISGFTTTWHWYDGAGMREMTETNQTTLLGYLALSPGAGTQSYYFYDGSDVALIVARAPTGVLTVAKHYLNGGLDHQLALKNAVGGYIGALALISDHHGSVLGAMRPDGLLEGTVLSYSTNAYGQVTGSSGTGGTSVDVGFAGASTPDPKGGFTYMRNRWYDPQTGRFLTQDPLGLAGGVNLYAYAGSNPIAFDDPFGLKCAGAGNCTQSDVGVVGNGDAAEKEWMAYENAQTAKVVTGTLKALDGLINACDGIPCMVPVSVGPAPGISEPYVRPSGATTAAQRASVQGQPCAVCGGTADRMVAGHKTPLVVEYYKTGTIDMQRARSLDAVRAECPACSAREGSRLSIYSRYQRLLNGFDGTGAGRSF